MYHAQHYDIASHQPIPSLLLGDVARAQRLDALFEALPAAVLLLDARGRVREANPSARQLFDVELIDRPWREVVAEQFIPGSGADLRLHDGRLLSLSTQPLGDHQGQVLLFTEVTEARRMSEALSHHRRLVDMGRMAASLAHQIRTPLSAAILYLSQLSRADAEHDGERSRRFSGKALERLHALERLISDMLLFARGERGDTEVLSAGELLAAALAPLSPQLQEQGVTACIDGDALDTPLRVNRELLVSALQNLINNAAEAMTAGQGGLVRLTAEAVDTRRLRLSVSDNGPGIAPEQQKDIFEPFVSHRAAGTGLGLAVVQAVSHAHQGTLSLESQPGEGSRFSLELPIEGER